MSTLPNGICYQDIHCYRSDDDSNTVYYIPGAPIPQRNADGIPAISLFAFDQMAMLQLSSQWDIPSAQLNGLKTYLEKQFPPLKSSTMRLSPAPVEVEKVTLTLTDQAGEPEILETARSSGHPPFSTVFSVQLSNEQKAQAISAFNGRKDILTVTYHAFLPKPVSAETKITGNVRSILNQLAKDASLQECLQQIEIAIAQNQLKLEQQADPEAPESLQQRTEQLVKQKAAELLQQMVKGATRADPNHLKVTATLTETIPVTLVRSTDVSSWFPNGKGLDYLQLIGT